MADHNHPISDVIGLEEALTTGAWYVVLNTGEPLPSVPDGTVILRAVEGESVVSHTGPVLAPTPPSPGHQHPIEDVQDLQVALSLINDVIVLDVNAPLPAGAPEGALVLRTL